MSWKNVKRVLKKTWHFIWVEDSILSWIVNIILAFVIIKFLLYPGIGLAMGTDYPIVAVVSGSMEHKIVKNTQGIPNICGNTYKETEWFLNKEEYWQECGQWYENQNITKEQFQQWIFKNGFNKGDIMFLKGKDPEKITQGDILVFQTQLPEPIIHRVVKTWEENGTYYYQTKGDHNEGSGSMELQTPQDHVYGVAWLRIPFLGYVKIIAVELVNLFR